MLGKEREQFLPGECAQHGKVVEHVRIGEQQRKEEPKSQGGRRREPLLWVSVAVQPRKLQGAAELENNTGGINLPFKDRSKRSVFPTFLIHLSTTFPI